MEILRKKLLELLEKFEERKILVATDKKDLIKKDALEVAEFIRDSFKKQYPHGEIRRLLKTVHYANTYEDKTLQKIAFLVDEISEYLFREEFANRDYVVGYFNTLVIGTTFEPTELNFVLMEIEALIENYNE